MTDDLDKIAEQVIETVQDAREEAAAEIADADEKADVISRLDAIEAKAVELEGSLAAVPTTVPEHSHDDIREQLETLLERTAETVEDVADVPVDAASDVIDTTTDAADDATGGEHHDTETKERKEPERRHSLFAKPFGRRD
jgi:DNA repair exonuclease SbcCD ATPase subunit